MGFQSLAIESILVQPGAGVKLSLKPVLAKAGVSRASPGPEKIDSVATMQAKIIDWVLTFSVAALALFVLALFSIAAGVGVGMSLVAINMGANVMINTSQP